MSSMALCAPPAPTEATSAATAAKPAHLSSSEAVTKLMGSLRVSDSNPSLFADAIRSDHSAECGEERKGVKSVRD